MIVWLVNIFGNENEINGYQSINELMRDDGYNFHKTILERVGVFVFFFNRTFKCDKVSN